MNVHLLSRCALTAIVVSAAGCASPQSGALTPATSSQSIAPLAQTRVRTSLSPAALPRVLAYVTDSGTNEVGIYSYPAFKLLEQFSAAGTPACTEPDGNVWFIGTGNSTLVEYAHGQTKPIRTLQDPGNYPVACAVDSNSGTLAVANILTTGDGPGNIALYARAKGKPRIVAAASKTYFITYDDRGNLFGDGESSSSGFELFELPKGANMIEPLNVNGATIKFPGSVQYADGALNVIDQEAGVNYELHVKGDTATVVGTTQLSGSSDVVQCDIYGMRLTCVDAGNADIEMYKYPAGGQPIKVVTGFSEPSGFVISAVPK